MYAVTAGVLAACVPFFTWFAITYSYRRDKAMVVQQVVKNLKVEDIAQDAPSAAAIHASPLHAVQSNPIMHSMYEGPVSSHRSGSTPRSTGRGRQFDSSMHRSTDRQWQHNSSMQGWHAAAAKRGHQLERGGSDNPLLAPGVLQLAPSESFVSEPDVMQDAMLGPTKDMRKATKQITVRCLRRWDSILGIRAGSDGLGRRSGIWRDKFDGVRYGVLLLAMRKLNEALLNNSANPSKPDIYTKHIACALLVCRLQSII